MPTPGASDVLSLLQQAAVAAGAAEDAFRLDFARRMDELSRERTFAYRRLNLVREMLTYAQAVDAQEAAAGAALAAVRRELQWDDDTPARAAILARLEPVAAAAAAQARGPSEESPEWPDLLAALQAFESWYEAEHGTPFWTLFDVYVPERPVVDF